MNYGTIVVLITQGVKVQSRSQRLRVPYLCGHGVRRKKKITYSMTHHKWE